MKSSLIAPVAFDKRLSNFVHYSTVLPACLLFRLDLPASIDTPRVNDFRDYYPPLPSMPSDPCLLSSLLDLPGAEPMLAYFPHAPVMQRPIVSSTTCKCRL